MAEPEDLSEESEINENKTPKTEKAERIHSDLESEQGDHEDEAAEERDIFDAAEAVDNHYETVELLHTKKEQFVNPAHQNDENSSQSQASKIPSFLESLDETDMFFLSMSRMAKKLPKLEQSQIKLALSNSVLSAEIRYNNQ